ncbi:hypothetical protein M569_02624 [Genlisea aurea]|uniref:DUF3054 domain-containing protein n=1 Tax=Genlisea aurea TaxID=192259 RepID=S8CXF0_9LAMI|nr:hypothetical protein M569_02624 [Genlisea aurea]
MVGLLLYPAAEGGCFLSSRHSTVPHSYSRRRNSLSLLTSRKPPLLAGCVREGTAAEPGSSSSSLGEDKSNDIAFADPETFPLEGVIQFEKPNPIPASFLDKLGIVALLAGGDVSALLLLSAIGRFSHGLSVFDPATLRTADPFIAGWLVCAYLVGAYGDDGQGKKGLGAGVAAAAKSWCLGIPLGVLIRGVTSGHVPASGFVLVTMVSTGVLLVGGRALLMRTMLLPPPNDVYRRGSPFELFELLTSLVRRW